MPVVIFWVIRDRTYVLAVTVHNEYVTAVVIINDTIIVGILASSAEDDSISLRRPMWCLIHASQRQSSSLHRLQIHFPKMPPFVYEFLIDNPLSFGSLKKLAKSEIGKYNR